MEIHNSQLSTPGPCLHLKSRLFPCFQSQPAVLDHHTVIPDYPGGPWLQVLGCCDQGDKIDQVCFGVYLDTVSSVSPFAPLAAHLSFILRFERLGLPS